MDILQAVNISFCYKNRKHQTKALDDVNCLFSPGKVYALTGKSGSGKTTLLSLLAGLGLPTSGQVVYKEQSLNDIDRNEYRLRNASVIYQDFNLFPMLTVLENVAFPLKLATGDKETAEKAAVEKLGILGMDNRFHNRFPSMLSGGERQRVAIARALASNVDILLADEPTGNLDEENTQNIVSIMCSLAKENKVCVIIATHDPYVVSQVDCVYKLENGVLQE